MPCMRRHYSDRKRIILVVFVGLIVGVAVAVVAVAPLRWRAQLLAMYVAGMIPDIELRDLLAYMSPASRQSVARLIETRNPYAVIENVDNSPADVAAGAQLFRDQCATCHSPDGTGS